MNKPNVWLTDKEVIQRLDFHDTYYLENLLKEVSVFLDKCPVPVITSWDPRQNRIYFMIGKAHKHFLEIDIDVSYPDFIVLLRKWLLQFYPQYECRYNKNRKMTASEIAEKVKTGEMDFNEALQSTKEEQGIEKGIIYSIRLLEDKFRMDINDVKYIRISTIPLSAFLKTFRRLSDNYEKKAYIEQNSKVIHKIYEEKQIELNLTGKQLNNFFRIRVSELYKFPLKEQEDGSYLWGKFHFTFGDSEQLKNECFGIIENHKFFVTNKKENEEIKNG